MYIIIAIIIFGLLITIHELGHFIAAKLCDVKVSEFAVGMGPAIFKKQKGETLYALRALPIGGYCAMDEDEGESEDRRAFVNKAWWKRLIILISGAGMNFLAGFLVLLFIVQGFDMFIKPEVTSFLESCPYESVDGFQVGDEVYKIDDHRIYFKKDIDFALGNGDGVYNIQLIRDGKKITLENFHMSKVEYTENGEKTLKYGLYFESERTGILDVIDGSWKGALDFVRMVWMGLGELVSGNVGLSELSGPVGIVGIINDVGSTAEKSSDAAFGIAFLAAFIAVNLAVMNMLPIPALDGGRVFFLLISTAIEKTTKKKLNPKYEGYVHTAGMVLLLGLMAVVMFSDIYKLFQ